MVHNALLRGLEVWILWRLEEEEEEVVVVVVEEEEEEEEELIHRALQIPGVRALEFVRPRGLEVWILWRLLSALSCSFAFGFLVL